MSKVFAVLVTYPYNGNPEDIELFSSIKLARKWVFKEVKRYVSELSPLGLTGEEDDHPKEWRDCVDEDIGLIEEQGLTEEFLGQLLEDFDNLDRQFVTFSIEEKNVRTKL